MAIKELCKFIPGNGNRIVPREKLYSIDILIIQLGWIAAELHNDILVSAEMCTTVTSST